MGQSVVYFFLARRTLSSYQRSIRHLFSDTSRIDLNWAKLLVNGYILTVFSALAVFSLILRYPEQFNLLLLINMTISTGYIYIATYKGLMQPAIWQVQTGITKELVQEEIQEVEELETNTSGEQKPKTTKPVLSKSKMEETAQRITGLMEHEKLYQEAELTLQQLAEKLQLPTYQVSLVINEGMKRNFYDLVNSYRVEEAKRLLADPNSRNFTILSAGFEAGFNSKTTFNTVFKKFTGLTPTDFRDQQKSAVLVT
jgi:YesN/AraC family two-component response regulator